MKYRHPYPESTGETDMAAHHDHVCVILRELNDDERDLEDVGRMFHVRFMDGFEVSVFEDEIDQTIHRHVGSEHEQGDRATCPECKVLA